MIDDGPQFKLMLYRMVKRFDLDITAWPRPPDRTRIDWGTYWQCRFEDVVFRFALGARKLIEAAKLSIETQGRPVEIEVAPRVSDRLPDQLNYHRIGEFYDLDRRRIERVSFLTLCHAIVHSYVLVPEFEYSGMSGLRLAEFIVASDRGRGEGVYVIRWSDFVTRVVWPVVTDNVRGGLTLRAGEGDELRIPLSSDGLLNAERSRVVEEYRKLSRDHAKEVKRFLPKWKERIHFLSAPDSKEQSEKAGEAHAQDEAL